MHKTCWFVAYMTVTEGRHVDHWLPLPDEKSARDFYAGIIASSDTYCACIGPIMDATEPHYLTENGV